MSGYAFATFGRAVGVSRSRCRSFIIMPRKVAITTVFCFLCRRAARVGLFVTSGKLLRMCEKALHSSRACAAVSTAPSSQKGHKVARGSLGVHFPVSLRRLWEPVRIEATFLCAEMFTDSRRYATGLSHFSL